jgi:anti-sigma-K factor RskA
VSGLSHEEIQELLGAYALHAVDPDEQAIIELHLEDCPRCQQEVRGHREVAALLGNSGGIAPDGLWDRIAGQLEESPPPMRLSLPEGQGNVIPLAARPRGRSNRFVVGAIGAAAALVIGLLGAQVLRQDDRINDLETALDGTSITGASVATLTSPDGDLSAQAVVLSNGTGYLLASELPGLTVEQTYQLWGITDTGVVSLGVLGAAPGALVPFQAGEVDQFSGLAITPEVAGGVEQPAHEPVVVGEFA